MSTTYHVQKLDLITFIAKKEDGQWTSVAAALTAADALTSLESDADITADLDLRTMDPLSLIEAAIATAFQREVWREICKIEPGAVASYAELAARIGRPKAYRAVANACGANRYAGIIPCHRVVGSDGNIGGYRWGSKVKEALLTFERSVRDDLEKP